MRPLRLDLAGFAAFREQATVDFTDADFFALVGPTGSGKSTVLDAICFALYGTVPRWRNTTSVANALAPSTSEARVRLAFEVAGVRYVATRVVRRDGKGRTKTAGAALQRMPDGFDVRRLDSGLTPEDLGEVLAGTPTEMDTAVGEVIGLPYAQFVTCVVLPQGEFAEFLHAKPATRQQILVNLLGFSVYERVRERAQARAGQAEAQLAGTDQLLAGLEVPDDETLAAAEAALAARQQLAEQVDATLPELAQAQRARERAAAALAARDAEIAQLGQVQPPGEAAELAGAAAAARTALSEAAGAVATAEETEEKLRAEAEATGAGDRRGTLRELLAAYERRGQLVTQSGELADTVEAAQQEYDTAAQSLAQARDRAQHAEAALEAAREAYQRAQTEDQATALRTHLVAGQPCPVCTQSVATVPEVPETSAVARAKAEGEAALAEAEQARSAVAEHDASVRDLERTLATARARAEALSTQVSELDDTLADAPEPAALQRDLDAIAAVEARLTEATAAVRTAREAYRTAQAGTEAAEQRLHGAWQEFDATRDALAVLGARPDRHGPPPADRSDLATAWRDLAAWAAAEAEARRASRPAAEAEVAAAQQAQDAVRSRIEELFTAAGVSPPDDDSALARAATVALERSRAEHDQLQQRRAQAAELAEQRAGHERDAQVARALTQHLRANNFEAWLLAEALDRLVEGASQILRELSGGQYDLVHSGREFFVVDHHDAGLRRGVRTLSGGETFQASLALALALSEQLAGMSTASASLESIVLDEGFGTLDATTLDSVAATLESLAARGDRMVGVVTHVPALAERIPVRFEVSKDARSARVSRAGF